MASEQLVKLAAKLYECRDAAKKLYGKEYKAKLNWYINRIYDYQKRQKVETLAAVLVAAAVEIIEPSKD